MELAIVAQPRKLLPCELSLTMPVVSKASAQVIVVSVVETMMPRGFVAAPPTLIKRPATKSLQFRVPETLVRTLAEAPDPMVNTLSPK